MKGIPDCLKAALADGSAKMGPSVNLPAIVAPGAITAVEGGNVASPGMVSEAKFTAQVIEYAQARGWKVAHFRGVRIARKDGSVYWQTPVQGDGKGFPDLILVRGKRLLAVELKVGKNTPEAEQKEWLAALELAGAEVYLWYPADWPTIAEELAEGRKSKTRPRHGVRGREGA